MFRTYYARISHAMGDSVRLVGVTGVLQGGLLRVVDVDISGNPIGEPSFIPASFPQTEMVIGPNGFLIEKTDDVEEEIDWEAHESRTGAIREKEDGTIELEDEEEINSDGKVNPAMAAFPHLQG